MFEKLLVGSTFYLFIVSGVIVTYITSKIFLKIDHILELKERAKAQRAKAQRAEAQKIKNLKKEHTDMFQMLKKI